MLNILRGKESSKLSKEDVYDFQRAWLLEQIELSQRILISEEPFSKVAYHEYIAYHLGMQKAYRKLLELLPDKGRNDN